MMALRHVISSKLPMVIILGATGTGKTKLSVELARKFDTEIISADSMQIYKGLDIVTAKASSEERELVHHHLLDLLEPHQMFTVVDFRNRALKIIQNLIDEGKIPIVVGGTNYYIESIVYKILVEEMNDSEALLWDKSKRKRDYDVNEYTQEEMHSKKTAAECKNNINNGRSSEPGEMDKVEDAVVDREKLKEDIDNEIKFSNEEIHAKLKSVDPVMASRLHPNNRRKVLRSIELWLKTGRRHSEVLDEQKLSEGQLRRPGATVILWLKCDQAVLDERLNARVDSMLQEGLIEELLNFHDRHNKQRIKDGKPPDYTKGVFQTLGLKEFHEYLMMSEEERSSDDGKKLLQQCIDNMKMATRRYARRQNKMVRGRFLDIPTREVPPIHELDTTDISKWDEEVKNKAIEIIESYINDIPCRYEPLKRKFNEEQKKIDTQSSNYCEVCERLIIGDKEYSIHMNSYKHMRVIKRKKKIEEKKNKEQNSAENS